MQIGLTSGSVDRSYADAFRSLAGDLQGVRDRIDYLRELGVTYLHLMPLLAPRDDPTMAGTPSPTTAPWDPRLGDMDDLRQLAAALREHASALSVAWLTDG